MASMRTTGSLDSKDYKIILILDQNPSLSNAKIAEKVGVAPETVRLRLQTLKEKGVLRPDRKVKIPLLGERGQSEAESAYLPSKLGLIRHHVIFTGINSCQELDKLKKLCDAHPHTHYRVVAFGDGAALYTQFDVPPAANPLIRKLYAEIKHKGLCTDYLLVESKYTSEGGADLQRWNAETNRWEIEYGKKSGIGNRLSRLETMWAEFVKNCPPEDPPEIKISTKAKFDELDLMLLRELTVNARPSFKLLGKVYDKDPTTISRRVDRIREHFAPIDILYYDRSVFDLTYPQLMVGEFKDNDELNPKTFHWFLQSEYMPFESKGTSDGHKFVLFTTTPPSFAPELSEFFWEHANNIQIFQLQLDASFTYFFYHENWSPQTGWRADEQYVLHDPMTVLD
ncbi:MAG: winged helix-turn-helix domain-containing protein [Candidatus Thorarchaeota archaeon]|nr:winged helix-turn-helix domain-containing protein [Candidatus Thorarchaeota archaeon]